jgi:hypothetical protein
VTSSSFGQMTRHGGILLIISFTVYLVLVVWVVLWKLEAPWVGDAAGLARPIKIVPSCRAETPGRARRPRC